MRPRILLLGCCLCALVACQTEKEPLESSPASGVSADKIAAIEARQETLNERLTRFDEQLNHLFNEQKRIREDLTALQQQGDNGKAFEALDAQVQELEKGVLELQRHAARGALPPHSKHHSTALPRPKGSGKLTINAVPAAEVYVNGQLVAERTPLVGYELSAGPHRVKVKYKKSGAFSAERNVFVDTRGVVDLFFSE